MNSGAAHLSFSSFGKSIKLFFSKIKKTPVAEIYLYIVVALYPLLPTYFVVAGARVNTIIALGCLLLLFTTPQIKTINLSIPKVIVVSIVFLGYTIPAVVNREILTTGFLSHICNYFVIPIYFALLIDSKEKFDRCINILLISAFIIGLFSIVEIFGFNIFSLIETVDLGSIGSKSAKRFGLYRIESGFGQAIAYSIYISFIICLVYYKLFKPSNQTKFKQNLYLLFLVFLNVLLVISGSRFPLMVMALVQIAFFIKLNKRSKIKVAIFVAIVAAATAAIAIITGGGAIYNIIKNIFDIFNGDTSGKAENPFGYRLSLVSYSSKIVGGDIFFGRGLHVNENFYIVSKLGIGLFHHASFDNGYLSIYITQGIIGLLAWVVFCYSIFSSAILTYEKWNSHVNVVMVAIVAICLLNMFSVARLDESRAFVTIIGCYLGVTLNIYEKPKNTLNNCACII